MFFQNRKWIEGISRTYDLKTYSPDSEIITLVEINSLLFGHRLISLPFCEYGINTTLSEGMVKELRILKKKIGAQYIEIRADQKIDSFHIKAEYLTFTLHGDNIWAGIDRKLRHQIKHADKLLELRKDDLDAFYNFYLKHQTRRGTPVHSKEFFQNSGLQIYLAYRLNSIVSAIIIGVDGDYVNWWGNINNPKLRHLNGTSWLLWKVIEERGTQDFTLDLGRTRSNSPVFQFKKQWGGIRKPIYSMTDVPIANTDPTDQKIEIASNIWKRLPLSIAGRLGPLIVKDIGL